MRKFWFFFLITAVAFTLAVSSAKAQTVPTPNLNSAIAISSCAVRLNWSQSQAQGQNQVQQTRFDLSRNDAIRNNFLESASFGDFSQPDLINLSPYTNYAYKVRAYNLGWGHYSDWSNEISARTNALPERPGVPRILNDQPAGVTDNSNINLRWTTTTPVLAADAFASYGGFKIDRAASANGGESYGDPIAIEQRRIPWSQVENNVYFYNDGPNLNQNLSYKYQIYVLESGGEYCNDNENHIVVSSPSPVIIPTRPGDLAGSYRNGVVNLSWRDNSTGDGNETRFELWRKVGQGGNYIRFVDNITRDSATFIDRNVEGQQTYFYKIKSCRDNYCSFFSGETSVSTGIEPPLNLQARVIYVDENRGSVSLKWAGDIFEGSVYYIERAVDNNNFERIATLITEVVAASDRTYYDQTVQSGHNYRYRVWIHLGNFDSSFSNVEAVNLNLASVLIGWAWSSNFGWLAMNSEVFDDDADIPYGVYVDSEGFLSGYAWSSNAGWLSFNKADLAGCPAGTCEAKADLQTRALRGWAKFIGADPTKGAWQGWLSLSEIRQGGQQGFNDKVKNFFANLIGLFLRK